MEPQLLVRRVLSLKRGGLEGEPKPSLMATPYLYAPFVNNWYPLDNPILILRTLQLGRSDLDRDLPMHLFPLMEIIMQVLILVRLYMPFSNKVACRIFRPETAYLAVTAQQSDIVCQSRVCRNLVAMTFLTIGKTGRYHYTTPSANFHRHDSVFETFDDLATAHDE